MMDLAQHMASEPPGSRPALPGGLALAALLVLLLLSGVGMAMPRPSASASGARWVPEPVPYSPDAPWSSLSPYLIEDLELGRPLVTEVFVPLCSNDQIDCGSTVAGRPDRLDTNLYWGAVFGARRFLDRPRSAWTRVELTAVDQVELRRATYRRQVPAERFDLERSEPVTQIVVLHAIHGSAIDQAVARFWNRAATGGSVTFHDGTRERTERVHAVGYVGHNRMLDGLRLPPTPRGWEPVPAFVLGCYSEHTFRQPLLRVGAEPLVMTRALMAPEGYVLDAVLRGLGDNYSTRQLRTQAVKSYARWQRLSPAQASGIFAPR